MGTGSIMQQYLYAYFAFLDNSLEQLRTITSYQNSIKNTPKDCYKLATDHQDKCSFYQMWGTCCTTVSLWLQIHGVLHIMQWIWKCTNSKGQFMCYANHINSIHMGQILKIEISAITLLIYIKFMHGCYALQFWKCPNSWGCVMCYVKLQL